MPATLRITTVEALRALYPTPQARAVKKQLAALDGHCHRFIALSPFVVLASADSLQHLDASPRGGAPGFVRVDAQGALLIPDAPGNNRLDSLENIVATGRIGLLFMIPGVDETLRVNGSAVVTRDAAEMQVFVGDPRPPRLVIKVSVEAAYLHCAKAFMRSRLWSADAQIDRRSLPTAGQMISEQTGVSVPPETQEAMVARYQADL